MDTVESVYAFICNFIETQGYSPSQREIASGCYMSVGNVVRYLDKLEARGLVYREPYIPRSIRLLDRKGG
jgi:DNA-binding MarR family transcriptional regulator